MPYTEDNHQLIEAYFNDALSTEEKAAFENRYANDEDFAQQVLFYKMTELSANEIQKEQVIGKIKKNNQRRNFIIVTFVILLVSILGWFVIKTINSPDDNLKEKPVFADNNISTIVDKSVVLGEEGKVDWEKVAFQTDSQELKLNLQNGIDAYYNGNYKAAIQTLTPLVSKLSMANFYRGAAYFKDKNYDAALNDFTNTEDQILDNLNLMFETRWFSALTYIQLDQNEAAIEKLQTLDISEKYKTKAQQLITELSK